MYVRRGCRGSVLTTWIRAVVTLSSFVFTPVIGQSSPQPQSSHPLPQSSPVIIASSFVPSIAPSVLSSLPTTPTTPTTSNTTNSSHLSSSAHTTVNYSTDTNNSTTTNLSVTTEQNDMYSTNLSVATEQNDTYSTFRSGYNETTAMSPPASRDDNKLLGLIALTGILLIILIVVVVVVLYRRHKARSIQQNKMKQREYELKYSTMGNDQGAVNSVHQNRPTSMSFPPSDAEITKDSSDFQTETKNNFSDNSAFNF